ncbi:MAG: phospho-sugar mutase [Deltaproteobacteria bacterium]|nr:phospho-sugar mutase [Deltaproteobacteria bacterium]
MNDERAARWLSRDPDPTTRSELSALIEAGDEAEISRRFAGRLAFGTAGLRGVVGAGPSRMNRLVIRETSAGLADYLIATIPDAAARGVVVGYDGRIDSKVFAEDTAGVLAAKGLRVYLSDQEVPTPVCAFALKDREACAAVVVTASHNPPEYNGYKVYWKNGAQIIPPHDAGIAQAIDQAAAADEVPWIDLDEALAAERVSYFGDALIGRYLDRVAALSVYTDRGNRASLAIAYTPLHGVGAKAAEAILRRVGFLAVSTVSSQREPDGHFPTVRFPNPEEPGAMDAVLALAKEHVAPLVLANDPDADRLAVAVRKADGDYRQLTGDQVGILLGLDRVEALGGEGSCVAMTVVSSQLLGVAAKARGASAEETLTGFKWIMNAGLARQAEGTRCLFGYEEALGYCVGDVVHDKDGISAAMCFAELAAELAAQGETVLSRLEAIYREFGLYVTGQRSLALDPSRDVAEPTIGDKLRARRPDEVAGRQVEAWVDLSVGKRYGDRGVETPVSLPPSDVLIYHLADGARIVVRPSGTEPKIKCYYELRVVMADDEAFAAAEARAAMLLTSLIATHQEELADLG